MEAHYFQNDSFMRPNQLLDNAAKLAGIPGIIVQGRYDLLCPPATSQGLAARWSDAEIRIVEGAGHTLYDPGVRDAVMRSIADLAAKIEGSAALPRQSNDISPHPEEAANAAVSKD